jgi:hypothetical protein
MIRSITTLMLVTLCGATSVSAQGMGVLNAAKASANRAVNATNEHIHEETGQAITKRPVNPVTPAASAKPAATPAATSAAKPTGKAAAATPAAGSDSAHKAAAAPATATFNREVFTYDAAGRRDPFLSLLSTGELRPAFNDLKLVAVAYDPTGRKSIAVMRDVTTRDQYRVKVGQTLGRMRVAQIHPKSVTFTIDEFGYSRQDVLTLGDSTNMRNP